MAAIDLDRISGLIKPILDRIPKTARGPELHRRIGDLIENADISLRVDLKEALDSFLVNMIKVSASDIDLEYPVVTEKSGIEFLEIKTRLSFLKS